jgi:hypothetical protein
VKLKDHPALSHRKLRSWPPVWAWIGLNENKHPIGEVGILKEVHEDIKSSRCFLTIEYENEHYMGCLFVKDPSFCRHLSILLQQRIGYRIEQIGNLDLSSTL